MNKNKGFIGIGLIIAIVLGVVVVGGGAYYIGKSGEKKEVNNPQVNLPIVEEEKKQIDQNQNTSIVENTQTDCNSNSIPSIAILSPNGGEVFTLGQTINIKWNSKCIDSKALVYLNIGIKDSQAVSELLDGMKVANTGSYNFIIPSNYNVGGNKSNKYVVGLTYVYGNGNGVSDISDNSFTINSEKKDVSTANWKTHDNYGLSFKYPDTWSKDGEESRVTDLSGNIVAYEIYFKDTISNTTFLISYNLPPNGSKRYDYVVSEFNSKHGWYETGSKEIEVAGIKAIEAFTTVNIDGRGHKINPPLRLILIDFLDKQKTGSIQLQFKTPITNEEIEVAKFNKLLSTFKLLLPQ